ncbi:acyl-CoA dehydrogenase family protein [Saccharopolyspora sp. TS4A08]|uniref:Acyl-CoA dehydrogenase family protein n=1 Tax=Saccharopolyspora ipomoeae TaxID=3042027 RepID=A0ABT6PPB9_9PSEU|nr:acyl-CoA dehydrogenase family protein [Saccharopolyspora sp. TS4A08]MDI2029685.1 acyl-CoA dehydrogenase family protein [Saccharopolyspora sp. TS4A08]
MDFTLTEAQEDLAGLVGRILGDKVTNERLREIDRQDDRFDLDLWAELAKADVLTAALPGRGFGLLEQCSILIEIGRAVAPVPYLPSITMGATTLAESGTDEHRRRWVEPAARGEVVLTAALVEDGNPDPASPATRAERDGEDWLLTGTKVNVPAGPIADLVLVPATTDDGPRLFLVRPGRPGATMQRQEIVDGDAEGWLELASARVADADVLGADALQRLVVRATIGVCAVQVGVLTGALERTSSYAGERVQFGRPIGSFQAVAQRLADGFIDVEAAKLTLWQAAWRAAEGLPCDEETATAKFWAAEAGHRLAHTAVHVHGGVGIDLDHELHRYFVAAKRGEFSLGGATAQLRRIGAGLAAR